MANTRPMLQSRRRVWLLSNCGNPVSTHWTRKEAKEAAEALTGKPWDACRDYMEVRKATIVEGWR